MACMLLLYWMKPDALLGRTVLAEEVLSYSKITQRIKEAIEAS